MRARPTTAAVTIMLLAAGCASADKDRYESARVRVVTKADDVRGCALVGTVSDNELEDLQRKAARAGGNTALLTPERRTKGGYFGLQDYQTADVYRCESTARSVTPIVTPPAPPASAPGLDGLTGTYTGEVTGGGARVGKVGVTFSVVQSGGEIAGTWTTTSGSTGTLAGVVTENGIRDLRFRKLNPCSGDFNGVAILEPGMILRGSYVGRDCSGSVTGLFTVTRQ